MIIIIIYQTSCSYCSTNIWHWWPPFWSPYRISLSLYRPQLICCYPVWFYINFLFSCSEPAGAEKSRSNGYGVVIAESRWVGYSSAGNYSRQLPTACPSSTSRYLPVSCFGGAEIIVVWKKQKGILFSMPKWLNSHHDSWFMNLWFINRNNSSKFTET